jgi:hypothetical protein
MAYAGIALSRNFWVTQMRPFCRSSRSRIVAKESRGLGEKSVEGGSNSTGNDRREIVGIPFVLGCSGGCLAARRMSYRRVWADKVESVGLQLNRVDQ